MSRAASNAPRGSRVTTQHRGWIRTAIQCAAFGYGAVCATSILTDGGGVNALWSQEFLVFTIAVVALFVERSGRALLAGAIAFGAVWLELHVTLAMFDGRSSASTVIPAWVVGVGALLGGRAGFAAGILSAFSAPLAYQVGGWLGITGGLRAEDTSFHVTASLAALTAGAVIAALQRSLKAAFRRVERDGKRSRELLNALPVGILAVSKEGKIVAGNPTAERILAGSEELAGRNLRDLPLRRNGSALDELKAGVFEVTAAEGDLAVLEATALPWSQSDDESEGFLLLLRDVTEERAAREREDELRRQLDHSQRMEAIGLLAGGVAHDFNNLLTIIGGNAQLLVEIDDPDVFEPARDMLLAQQQGAALTRQLLTFARKDVVSPKALDLASEVARSLPLLHKLAGEQISIDVATDPAWAQLDPGQLEQVLFNLTANARDAMAPDGGRLFLSSRTEDEKAILEVRDTGSGMTAEVRNRLFEPFFTTKGMDGTGLGLATVHGIVERAGGTIDVESSPGEGTTFRVAWPATASADAVAPVVPRRRPSSKCEGVVMLVEDNERARRSLARVLEHAGYEVIQAPRGDRALAMLAQQESAPSIVVTDLQMPGMSGLELAERLVELHPNMPVVLMSGYIDDALRVEAKSSHREILFKPFHGDVLIDRIEEELAAATDAAKKQQAS